MFLPTVGTLAHNIADREVLSDVWQIALRIDFFAFDQGGKQRDLVEHCRCKTVVNQV